MSTSTCYDHWDYYSGFVCCDDQMIPEHKTEGVANTDYVMHVTARPSRSSIVAWAFPCQNDQNYRPLSGQINFVPHKIDTSPDALRASFIKALHELFHNLGFSDSLFPYYRKPGTNRAIGGAYKRVLYPAGLQKTISTFVMENALEKMKEHFDCYDLPASHGVELEDGGGGSTAGKHLEERIFHQELMSGWIDQNTRVTPVSLAFLQDSGWYQVDYSGTETMGWGNGEGCDFVTNRCDQWPDRYFCEVANEEGCSPDLLAKGVCNVYNSGAAFESKFQYFPESPSTGGKFSGADYCPFYSARSNGDCSSSTTPLSFFYGETSGAGSRCMMGDYQLASYSRERAHHGACLKTSCLRNTILTVTIAPGRPYEAVVECPVEGGDVDLGALPETQNDWVGILKCPPARLLCNGDPCSVQDCSGHGRCVAGDGSCVCNSGYYGADEFACDRKRCPVGEGGDECSGHGNCNTQTGVCSDAQGLPGCFPGYKGLDCSELGCPSGQSPQCTNPSGCECSARGQCSQGVCLCDPGYISSDCSLTECPGTPSCGGVERGNCDQMNGLCECGNGVAASGSGLAVYYAGSGCEAEVVGEAAPRTFIHFDQETNTTSGLQTEPLLARLPAEEYIHFEFVVPSVEYDYQLTVTATWWNASGAPQPPRVVAAYDTFGTPTLRRHQFLGQEVSGESNQRRLDFQSESTTGDGPSSFNQVGTMRVSIVAQASTAVSISLTRDGCAVLDCGDFGGCVQGQCICNRRHEQERPAKYYGYSGAQCEVLDCPGTPDCGGARGTCLPPDPEADSTVDQMYPRCECEELFEGESCQRYSLPSGTAVFGAALDALNEYAASDDGNPQLVQSAGGVIVANYSGTVGVGEQTDRLLIDPAQLVRCCGVNGTASVLVTLDARASGEGADPMLLGRTALRPSLDDYDQFDSSSWAMGSLVHQIQLSVRQGELAFVSVANGRYGSRRLRYRMTVELASGTCPPSLDGCSGNGIGECREMCSCQLGWEGLRCEVPTPVLPSGSLATTPVLAPGEEVFFVHPVPDDAREIRLSARSGFASAPGAQFTLKAAFERTRNGRSLSKLYSEAAIFDYAGHAARNGSQDLVIERPDASTRFLFLSVRNLPQATGDAIADIAVVSHAESSLEACGPAESADECGARQCSGRGVVLSRNGEPFCECEPGWSAATRCAAPRYSSFSQLQNAAQTVDYLCSICESTLELQPGELTILKVPPPLQLGSSLRLEVVAIEGGAGGANDTAAASRRMRRGLQVTIPVGDDDGTDSVVADATLGSVSLLASNSLPRSISDFSSISSTGSNVSIDIQQSADASSIFVAAHAHRGGTFRVRSSRSRMEFEALPEEYFVKEVAAWVLGTSQGRVVLGMAGAFVALVLLGCLFDQCAPDSVKHCLTGGSKEGKDDASRKMKQMRVVKDVRSMLSQPSVRRLASGRSLGTKRTSSGALSSSPAGGGMAPPGVRPLSRSASGSASPGGTITVQLNGPQGGVSVTEGAPESKVNLGADRPLGEQVGLHAPPSDSDSESLPSESEDENDEDLELLPPADPMPQAMGYAQQLAQQHHHRQHFQPQLHPGTAYNGHQAQSTPAPQGQMYAQGGHASPSRVHVHISRQGSAHGGPGSGYGGMPVGMQGGGWAHGGHRGAGGVVQGGGAPGMGSHGMGRAMDQSAGGVFPGQAYGGAPPGLAMGGGVQGMGAPRGGYQRYVPRRSRGRGGGSDPSGGAGGAVGAGTEYYKGAGSRSGRRVGSRRGVGGRRG